MKNNQLNLFVSLLIKTNIIFQMNLFISNNQFIYALDSCWDLFDPQLREQCGTGIQFFKLFKFK